MATERIKVYLGSDKADMAWQISQALDIDVDEEAPGLRYALGEVEFTLEVDVEKEAYRIVRVDG